MKCIAYEITKHLLISKHIQLVCKYEFICSVTLNTTWFALPTLNSTQKDRENKYVIRTLIEGYKANQTKYII